MGLRRPDQARLRAAREAVHGAPLTYTDVGGTFDHVPLGWSTGSMVERLGRGKRAFSRAAEALAAWRMFDAPWLDLLVDGPPEVGRTVVYAARALGVWTINTNRVVDVERGEDLDGASYGFTWGTLPDHALSGEERFHVTWDRHSDEVTLEITQFSSPVGIFTLVPRSVLHGVQRKFSATALATLRKAVA